MTDIVITHFRDLSVEDLYAAMAVRGMVFVVGQKITDQPDLDGVDRVCWHVLLRHEGRIVGTCRLAPAEGGGRIKVGRLAVLPEMRGRGCGRTILLAVHDWLKGRPAKMHAQAYLEAWYASLGWRRVGELFDEAGIPHIEMHFGP